MSEWRYYEWKAAEGDDAIELWHGSPEMVGLELAFRPRGNKDSTEWWAVSVVTRAWVDVKLRGLTLEHGAMFEIWPPFIVIPDGSAEQRMQNLQELMARRNVTLERYSRRMPTLTD